MAARKKAAPRRGATRYQEPPRKPVSPLVWITCGLVLGILLMSLLKLEPGKDNIKRETAQPAASKPVAKTTAFNCRQQAKIRILHAAARV